MIIKIIMVIMVFVGNQIQGMKKDDYLEEKKEPFKLLTSHIIPENSRVFYDNFNNDIFMSRILDFEKIFYQKITLKETSISFGSIISPQVYKNCYLYRDHKGYKERKGYSWLTAYYVENESTFFQRSFLFSNWIHGKLYNYDLYISTMYDCFDCQSITNDNLRNELQNVLNENQGLRITLRQHGFFLNDKILSEKALKITLNHNIGIGQGEWWCKSIVCDGVSIFILAERVIINDQNKKNKNHHYLMHYQFNFEQLKNALENESNLQNDNYQIENSIKFIGKYDFGQGENSDFKTEESPTCLCLSSDLQTLFVGTNQGTLLGYDYKFKKNFSIPIGNMLSPEPSNQPSKVDQKFFNPIEYIDRDSQSNRLIVGYKSLFALYTINLNFKKSFEMKDQAYSYLTKLPIVGDEKDEISTISYKLSNLYNKSHEIQNFYKYYYQKDFYQKVSQGQYGFFVCNKDKEFDWKLLNFKNGKLIETAAQKENLKQKLKTSSVPLFYQDEEKKHEYDSKVFWCVQNNLCFVINNEKMDSKRSSVSIEKIKNFLDAYFYIQIINYFGEDENKYNNSFFLKQSNIKGNAVVDFCTDAENIFLVTDKNEILHYTITLSKSWFWGFFVEILFKKRYTINQRRAITGIGYYKKGLSIILGFEDGALRSLDISTGGLKKVDFENFGEPIYDIVLNGNEENILIASKSKFAIYDLQENDKNLPLPSFLKDPIEWIKTRRKHFSVWLGLGTAATVGSYHLWQKYKQNKK